MKRSVLMFCCVQSCLWAQEASSGFELRATVSEGASYSHELEEAPRSGSPLTAGFRSVLYPTWKLSKHWAVSGAIQIHSPSNTSPASARSPSPATSISFQ